MSVFKFTGSVVTQQLETFTGPGSLIVLDTADGGAQIVNLRINETSGGTPTLTVDLYNPATGESAPYGDSEGRVWKGKALAPYQSIFFGEGYVVPYKHQIRATIDGGSINSQMLLARVPGYSF